MGGIKALPPLHHTGRGPIPKEDTGGTVGVIGDGGKPLGADDQDTVHPSGVQIPAGHVQSGHKTGTSTVEIQGKGIVGPQMGLGDTGQSRGVIFWGHGGEQYQVDGSGIYLSPLQSVSGRQDSHPPGGFPAGYPPLPHPGVGDDPLAAGLHQPLKILILHHLGGQIAPHGADVYSLHTLPPFLKMKLDKKCNNRYNICQALNCLKFKVYLQKMFR